MTLGKKIQTSRKKEGLSQEELADILKVSRQAVQKWESDATQPELSRIVELSNVLNVSLDYLLKENIDSPVSEASDEPVLKVRKDEAESCEKRLNRHRYTLIKVFMIIGCVLSPAALGGSYMSNNQRFGPETALFLLLYGVSIPLCVFALRKCKEANKRDELVKWGILSAIFVSLIGGILILSSGERYFEEFHEARKEKREPMKKLHDKIDEISDRANLYFERKEKEKAERKALNALRKNNVYQVKALYRDFKVKDYRPSDIRKAKEKRNKIIQTIDEEAEETAMTVLIAQYKDYLLGLTLDSEFCAKRNKKIKKMTMILVPTISLVMCVAILTGTVFVPLGIYNEGMSLVSDGKYNEADAAFAKTYWGDASTQVKINKARRSFDDNDYEGAIDTLLSIGAEINVTYNLNGGEGKTSTTIKKAKRITNVPERNGYTFKKWVVFSYVIASSKDNYRTSLKLSATWDVVQYSIAYSLNGGKNNFDNPTDYTIESDTFTLLPPTKEGYSFAGWTGSGLEGFTSNVTIEKGTYGDLKYYAHWNANSYSVYLDPDGGECASKTISVTYDKPYFLPTPSKTGYTFTGWYEGDKKFDDSGVWGIASGISLKAKWEITNFKLTYNLSGGIASSLPSAYTYFDEDIVIPNPSKNGYEFEGWTESTELQEPTKDFVLKSHSLGDKTFKANWKAVEYLIEYDLSGGYLESAPTTYSIEERVRIPEPTRNGCNFLGWTGSNGTSPVKNLTISKGSTGPKAYTANWEYITYSIQYDLGVNDATNSTTNPSAYTVLSDEIVLNKPTRTTEGYCFDGWYSDESFSNKIASIPTGSYGNITLYAKWVGDLHRLSIKSSDESKGVVSVSGEGRTGETIIATACPACDCVFKGWYLGDSMITAENPYTFVMPNGDKYVDKPLVALFRTNAEEELLRRQKLGMTPVLSGDGKAITYGLYPQARISDADTIRKLETLSKEENDWYFLNGNYYATANAAPYSSTYKFDDGTAIESGKTYWFVCEPIEWKIISSSTDEYTLLSDVLLDAHRYSSTFGNNYENSEIRKWLNNDFYNSAFHLDNSLIEETLVDNSASTTYRTPNSYACDNTLDKIFLLSYQDYKNTSLGFSNSISASETRQCKTTDWARACGAYSIAGRGIYWTRSPSPTYDQCPSYVVSNGEIFAYGSAARETYLTARPALKIQRNL